MKAVRMTIADIPADLRNRYKAECAKYGRTMRQDIIDHMERVASKESTSDPLAALREFEAKIEAVKAAPELIARARDLTNQMRGLIAEENGMIPWTSLVEKE